ILSSQAAGSRIRFAPESANGMSNLFANKSIGAPSRSNFVRHRIGFAIFAGQVTVGLVVPHEPLFVRIKDQLSAGAKGNVCQVSETRRHVTLENVAVQILNFA